MTSYLYDMVESQINKRQQRESPNRCINSALIYGMQYSPNFCVASLFLNFHSMFDKEDDLPHLPVPALRDTIQKYVKAIASHTSEREMKQTEKVIEEFLKEGGLGDQLQARLIEKAEQTDNWLSDWWRDYAYMTSRDSVVINSSPGILFPKQTFFSCTDQYRYTAKLILSVLKFKHLVDRESIPTDYCRKEPVTMKQYQKLLSMSRLPQSKCDSSKSTPPEESRHVIVAHNNHFFSLCVFQEDSTRPLSEDELVQQLNAIVKASKDKSDYPVGVLTSQNRNTWAQGYDKLIQDSRNERNVELIESSICLVCLDQPNISSDSNMDNNSTSEGLNQVVHGGGPTMNTMNRWFDKPCQFIVNRNGFTGICYEHSGAEGPPVMALCDMIIEDSSFENSSSPVNTTANASLRPPDKLKWNICSDMADRIELAKDTIENEISNLELIFFKFDKFGKNIPKQHRVSPDAFFQVCLQVAFWRVHGQHPPTYETASLRKFSRGRTECIRSATSEATLFARELDETNYNEDEKKDFFMAAINAHVTYTIDAMNFNAVDRHLLGLKLTALEEDNESLPEFFRDKSFRYASHFLLSTSQVPSKHEALLCFGPVVGDGYGVCYNPMEEQFLCAVSSFRTHPRTDSGEFGEAIRTALEDVKSLLEKTTES